MELERARIDRGVFGPGDRRLARHDVEDVQPPGRPDDDLVAAVASDGDVVLDDGVDADAHQIHGPILAFGSAAKPARRWCPQGDSGTTRCKTKTHWVGTRRDRLR